MQQCKSCGLESCNYACSCERALSSFVHHLLFERMQHADTYRWFPRWFPGLACFFLLGASLLLGNWTAFALTSPVLKVSPTSFNLFNDPNCKSSSTSGVWTCYTTLTNNGKVSLKWSASSGASVQPSSGTLSPGKSILVAISGQGCVNVTVTFSGPANSVTVTVNCNG